MIFLTILVLFTMIACLFGIVGCIKYKVYDQMPILFILFLVNVYNIFLIIKLKGF